MSDDAGAGEQKGAVPLDYQTPVRSRRAPAVLATISGFIVAVLPMSLVSAALAIGVSSAGQGARYLWISVICYGLVALAALFGVSVAWHKWVRGTVRSFLLGFLIGVGLTALAEGACFAIFGPH